MTAFITPVDRIYVAGHRGMADSAICRAMPRSGYINILTATRSELDLLDAQGVQHWFAEHRPTVVVLPAAKVGGIQANNSCPADFLLENLKIQTHVIETAWRSGVRHLLFLGSSCIYPKFPDLPIQEEAMLCGPLEHANEWYPIAKITGLKLCAAQRLQHCFDPIRLLLTNLYGPCANYYPENSHVAQALIGRFHEAAEAHDANVTCWCTGTPLREFPNVDNLGEACLLALEHWHSGLDATQHLNVDMDLDVMIRKLAQAVAETTGLNGEIRWDPSETDGTPKTAGRDQADGAGMAGADTASRGTVAQSDTFSPATTSKSSENLSRK